MHSTDQLLSRIDSLLSPTNQAKTTDLHLRVMDLLDNPTQCARMLEWDTETLEVTAQDREELDWLEGYCSSIFMSSHQRDRFNMRSPCVVCDGNPSLPEYNNLFCSPYCEASEFIDPWADGPSSYYFDNFYVEHKDLLKPLFTSNVCVAPMYRLKV